MDDDNPIKQADFFINRIGWPVGPWDKEPDYKTLNYTAEVPIVLYRLYDGAWAALAGYDKKHKSRLLMFQRTHWLSDYPEGHRRMEFIHFHKHSLHLVDISKIWVGFFYNEGDDLKPLHCGADEPTDEYITLERAQASIVDLCDKIFAAGIW
jgi:hypothetical protein